VSSGHFGSSIGCRFGPPACKSTGIGSLFGSPSPCAPVGSLFGSLSGSLFGSSTFSEPIGSLFGSPTSYEPIGSLFGLLSSFYVPVNSLCSSPPPCAPVCCSRAFGSLKLSGSCFGFVCGLPCGLHSFGEACKGGGGRCSTNPESCSLRFGTQRSS
jgi:hypothetical protein